VARHAPEPHRRRHRRDHARRNRPLLRTLTLPAVPPFTEEHEELRASARGFIERELAPHAERWEREHWFGNEAFEKLASQGLLGLKYPECYGGQGGDYLHEAVLAEELARIGSGGVAAGLGAHISIATPPIWKFGSEEQKQRYLPGLCDGSLIAAHGMSEPSSGSDAFSLLTTATPTDDGWALNGSKTFVTNAPEADVLVVFATTDRNLGFAGLCAFLLQRDTPGLTVGAPLKKMGLNSSPMSELFLADCRVPRAQLIGPEGAGMAVFNDAMLWERGLILAASVGTMRRHLELSVAYASERKQFGKSIGQFQAISHRIADMRLRLETSRLMLHRFARLLDEGAATAADAALTKLQLSDSLVHSAMSAMEIHGGYGYMAEYPFEREVRDALGSRIYSGTSDMLRNVVAHSLGL
jgi:L-prolyl-PCP dehydrogenase